MSKARSFVALRMTFVVGRAHPTVPLFLVSFDGRKI
jgi:hypothetical protein